MYCFEKVKYLLIELEHLKGIKAGINILNIYLLFMELYK